MKSFIETHGIYLLIICIFSFFSCQKLFNNQFYTSHDGEGHLIRMEEFDLSFKDGQIPVRIAKRIDHGSGYPFFNFNYPLVYYSGEFLHLFGVPFLVVFKVLFIFSVLLGAIALYFLARMYFDPWSSVLASVFFTIAPYKFLNMYVRGNIAESIGLAIVPLFFLSIEFILRKKKWSGQVFIIILSILLLSHNITAEISIVFGILYIFFQILNYKHKRKIIFKFLRYTFISLLLTAFFWIPVLVENSIVRIGELRFDYPDFFPSIQELLYSPWGFGGFHQGYFPGKMSPQIGIVHEIIFVGGVGIFVWELLNKKKKNTFILTFLIIGMLSFFLATPYSKFLWDRIEPLQFVQLPFRFVGYMVLASSLCAAYFFSFISKKYKLLCIFICCGALLFFNRNHIRVNQYIEYHSPFEKSQLYGLSTTSKSEHAPLWSPLRFSNSDPNQNGDISGGGVGKSKRIVWKSNYHKFVVDMQKSGTFRDNTSYYPGWIAKIDGNFAQIFYLKDTEGRLLVSLPRGKHMVEFFFGEPWYRLLADIISFGTFLIFIGYNGIHQFLWIRKKNLKK